MNWIVYSLVTIVSFIGMEGVAWLAHKYIMHGILWRLHKDHHQPRYHSVFEKNDSFFVIFALPAIICFYTGYEEFGISFWVGVGISLYGLAYFFIHDLFIHQRIKILRQAEPLYFKAIRKAHKVHHKHLGKEEGECFGMLWAPLKYFKEAKAYSH
ncbi:MAG TPA: sterol desaturase family protein [Bacteroidia bacterium]|nr:sterol desaturase family protein [Bacteroidia bacterium]